MTVSNNPRFSAIQKVNDRVPRLIQKPVDQNGQVLNVSQVYGMMTFDNSQMKASLPKVIFEKLSDAIHSGQKLDSEVADTVAHAVKDWALSHGVSHFCHWFQPQTGLTAEKHDAFLTFDKEGLPIEKFSGSQLVQSEPDASSFPSGGMRTTFEARGYTAWDPSSPMFIMESPNTKTLCIPSAFISYTGDALDEKTSLLRSDEVLSQKAKELLAVYGDDVQGVETTLGTEQEYFLIDREFYSLRPDLVMSGRTLLGAQPPKGQQLDDHYFGTISPRVQAFMGELELELYKLGVPVKTRHNEVAPSQFEMAPIFELASLSADHNQLCMDMSKKVARRHNYECLFHEKPFAQLNGSGKHCNWSMSVQSEDSSLDQLNLLEPGKTPQENFRFLLFLVAVLNGVHKHAGLLRAGIASSGNDHRLGANEAPPAIISVFLGDMLTNILDKIESGVSLDKPEEAVLELGVSKIPAISKDNTDRNRTSPFAFTGNKFEFRAVGSSAAVAFPVTLLNAAVADSLEELTGLLKSKLSSGVSREKAVLELVKEISARSKSVRFEGNNYSDEWVKDAQGRGLKNLEKTPESLEELISPLSKETLTRLEIFNEAELESRFHVRMERYVMDLEIEVSTLLSIVKTYVEPVAYQYYAELAQGVKLSKDLGSEVPQEASYKELGNLLKKLGQAKSDLEKVFLSAETASSALEKAKRLSREVSVAMLSLRSVADEIEGCVPDSAWPLPKYREMLFL